MCSPPCGPGYLCTSGGACIREQPVQSVPQTPVYRAPTNECIPSCRSGYTCVTGQCVSLCNPVCPSGQRCTAQGECTVDTEPSLQSEEAGPAAPSPSPPSPPRHDSIVNLHLDVLGALQFGVTPTVEVGKRVSGYFRFRPFNTGVASYFLLARDRDHDLRWGIGTALGLHVFTNHDGNMTGFFGGPALEYAFVETRASTFVRYRDHALIPQLDFGNRWRFGSFLLGLGARVGLWVPVHTNVETFVGDFDCDDYSACEEAKLRFAASVFLDIGWFL
jgi:hypothetical protein